MLTWWPLLETPKERGFSESGQRPSDGERPSDGQRPVRRGGAQLARSSTAFSRICLFGLGFEQGSSKSCIATRCLKESVGHVS